MDAQKTRIRVLAACFTVISITAPAIAETPASPASTSAALSRIHIGNFGKINDNYFRGAQPKGSDYNELAAIGVKTVIDLQIDGPSKEASYVRGRHEVLPHRNDDVQGPPMLKSRSSSRS